MTIKERIYLTAVVGFKL